jgi:TolB protein
MLLFFQIVIAQTSIEKPRLDSLKIAFVSYKTGTADIYLMNTDGSNVEQITDSKENNSFPYQIDKRTIGFTRTDSLRNSSKFKVDIYSKKVSEIKEEEIRPCSKWQVESPDKKHWVFVRSKDYRDRELYLFNKEDGYEKQLTRKKEKSYACYSINHQWSSDGKKLAFMSGPDWFNQFIRIYDLEKDSILTVSKIGYMNSGLKWLKDNNTLIANLKIKDKTKYEIYSINISNGLVTQLTEGINLHPDVSPDGKWIVFESQRHNNYGEVYVMKVDGSHQIRLTNNANYNGRCIWFKL